VALTSWQGGAFIAAAHNGAVLRVFRARIAEGKVEYSQVAKVNLPSTPTDLAALHYPVPTLAVGCEGRCVSFFSSSTLLPACATTSSASARQCQRYLCLLT
jgi:hypothetical protein